MSCPKQDAKRPLLSFNPDYGAVYEILEQNKKIKKKLPQVGRKSGIRGLFRYASACDKAILAIGLLFSILHGSSFPLLALVFGEMTNNIMRVSKYGFINNGNVSGTLTSQTLNGNGSPTIDDYMVQYSSNSVSLTLKQAPIEGITKDEFLTYMEEYSMYYVYIGIVVLFTSFIQTYCWELACERQVYKLRQVFFSQMLRQDVSWYDKNRQGDLNTKLTDDLERVREGIGSKFSMITQYLATFVSGLTVGLYANWKLTVIILAVGPVLILTSAFWARAASTTTIREQLKYSLAGGVAEEVLTCVRTVIAFGGLNKEASRYEKALDEGRLLAMKKYYVISAGIFVVFFVMYASYGLAFWYGAELIRAGISTPGSIFTVFLSVLMGAFSIGNSLPYINSVSNAVGAASTIFEVIDRVPTIDSYSDEGLVPHKLNGYIELKNVVFTYPNRPEVKVLKYLNLKIMPGQTVAIVGASGAGKSTIVGLLMRLYDPSEGQVLIDGFDIRNLNLKWLREQIGVVSQEPVLFGVSILENISYGKEYVGEREIIAAAKLANAHSFIESLPEGYNTLVGTSGVQLSGGQKQRIAIARALVRDPKVLILDEATSALDAESEEAVQSALENAKRGRTTIVIAHRVSTVRNADIILTLKVGHIDEQGTHDELMAKKALYYNLVMAQSSASEKEEVQTLNRSAEKGAKFSGRIEKNPCNSNSSLSENLQNKFGDEELDVSFIQLLKMNAPEWRWLSVGLLFCCLSGLVTPTFAFFYSEVFSTFTLLGDELKSTAAFWSSMFVGLGAVSGISFCAQIICMSTSAEKFVARLRHLALKNVLRQQIAWFDLPNFSSGHLITRLARDAPLIKGVAGLRLGQVVSSLTTLGAALAIAFVYGWKLAILLVVAVPFLVAAGYHQTSVIRKTLKRDSKIMDEAGKLASECLQNVITVQSLGMENLCLKLYSGYLLTPFKESKKQALVFGVVFALSQTVIYMMYAAAFRFGGYLIGIEEMIPSEVYRVFFALSFCATSLGSTTAYLQDFTKSKIAARNIFELIKVKSETDPLSGYGVKPKIKGKVCFKNVTFSYPIRNDVSVLDDLCLIVSPGETLALVGGSGCGKSTIVSLLERFYTPNSGKILIDDVDIRTINVAYLRSFIGLVTQEPVLFNCSIKENISYGAIAFGKPATDQQIIEAAKTANIHNFIVGLPQGYETSCGERGSQLSGGQKQRIAIARALVRNPKILLLDEATSALDNESEKIVQAALDKACIGRTTIIIAHRLSTIKSADKIAVLQHGKIVEVGSHEELMHKNGTYYNLVERLQL